MSTERPEFTILMDDKEASRVTFGTDRFLDLVNKFEALSIYVDEEHDIFLLCYHPVTKELDYHSVVELLDPEKPKEESSDSNVTAFRKPLN